MLPTRQERLAQQLQQEIALIIQRELKDPHLGFVTIIRVALSSDVSHAKVYFSSLGTAQEREASQRALERAAPFVRNLLKKRLRLRITPALSFHYDMSIAGSIEIEQALDRLRQEPP
ncbi:MAG: 30S ribosome-binding factor RbfA [Candidatus Omnitrophica bacterium]|nr:30S ribosome-binding factor RbfA [Candidatus Omnitrophota bacterium]